MSFKWDFPPPPPLPSSPVNHLFSRMEYKKKMEVSIVCDKVCGENDSPVPILLSSSHIRGQSTHKNIIVHSSKTNKDFCRDPCDITLLLEDTCCNSALVSDLIFSLEMFPSTAVKLYMTTRVVMPW